MKGFDAFAGVIKSGGTTRRAAKMVILNADHPDIEFFITCKVTEERKAWALIDAGYDLAFTGEAYASVFFQKTRTTRSGSPTSLCEQWRRIATGTSARSPTPPGSSTPSRRATCCA